MKQFLREIVRVEERHYVAHAFGYPTCKQKGVERVAYLACGHSQYISNYSKKTKKMHCFSCAEEAGYACF